MLSPFRSRKQQQEIEEQDLECDVNIDRVIEKLVNAKVQKKKYFSADITEAEIKAVCKSARKLFLQESCLLRVKAPVRIVGDIHGQYRDLLRIFEYNGFPPASDYLFLGDYVDRGPCGLEVIMLLLCYKIKYPRNFNMIRGNHECASICRLYGFYDEAKKRYNVRIWKLFTDVFNCLPFAAIVGEKIFCVHGGLSPELKDLSQIENIRRPTEVPDYGLMCDFVWSDPSHECLEWADSDRGVSYIFGAKVVDEFVKKFGFELVVRAHQVVQKGYEFFAKRQLVTIFSAPNYCGEFDNAGAVLAVDENLLCSFQVLQANDIKK